MFYHETGEDFTTFDITKARSWEGTPDYDLPGFYFYADKQFAGDYGDAHSYYLTANKIWDESTDGSIYDLKKTVRVFQSSLR